MLTISICLILFRTIIIIGCAPKIRRQPVNPLKFETNILDNNNYLYKIQNRRKYVTVKGNTTQEESKAPCFGYDYDTTKCKYVNTRILCGYDKNLGEQRAKDNIIDMGNGCRLRGERIECGYVLKPFINIRRPLPHNHGIDTEHKEPAVVHKASTRTIDNSNATTLLAKLTKVTAIKKETETSTITNVNASKEVKNLKNIILPTVITTIVPYINKINEYPKYNSTKTSINRVTYKSSQNGNSNCVEKKEHIVCYDIPSQQ